MKCDLCKNEFAEKDIHESHDVPTYLWEENRQGRKNQADKFGRHLLNKECHDQYENAIRNFLRIKAKEFSIDYFKEVKEHGDTNT